MKNLTKPKAYLILFISIFLEIIGSASLKACDGFHNIPFTLLVIVTLTLSYYLFSKILDIIHLGIAYATWTSLGSVVSAFISVFIFKQPLSLIGWLAIAGLCLGVAVLNLYGTPKEEEAAGKEAD